MSEIKPIRVSNDEYNGCSDEQIRRARERFLELNDEDIIESRRSCNA